MSEDNSEQAEGYRIYFSKALMQHQIELLKDYPAQCAKVDREIELMMEEFANRLRVPGTGRN